jgi:hypothetical protein
MRLKMAFLLAVGMSLSLFASARAAESPAQDQTPPAGPAARAQGQMGPGMMTPEMMRRLESMMGRTQNVQTRTQRMDMGGPLRRISMLLAALDNPGFRSRVGLSEQQAENLRKIIVDAETFTITTGAGILVDSIQERELLRADHPDKGAIMDKGNQISKSISQLIDHYLNAILAAKAMLTPEQQRMFREYMERGAAAPVPAGRP